MHKTLSRNVAQVAVDPHSAHADTFPSAACGNVSGHASLVPWASPGSPSNPSGPRYSACPAGPVSLRHSGCGV